MIIDDLIKNRPLLHTMHDKPEDWGISNELVVYLKNNVKNNWQTLETGSGLSTLVFLILGKNHTAINVRKLDRTKLLEKINELNINKNKLNFILGRAEKVLPNLKEKYDAILIDGCHTFPYPILDWYYASLLIKKDGLMILDDIDWWPVKIVYDYMNNSKSWQRLINDQRFAVFKPLKTGIELIPPKWELQPKMNLRYAKIN